MASSQIPRIGAYLAGGTIVKGHAVKLTAEDTVIECTANTDETLGLAQSAASSGQTVEVALPGGGGKALLGENVLINAHLVSHTDGTLVKVNSTSDRVCARATVAGSSGEIIGVEVMHGTGFASE